MNIVKIISIGAGITSIVWLKFYNNTIMFHQFQTAADIPTSSIKNNIVITGRVVK